MSRSATKDNLFKPKPSKAETKADITDHTARAIIGDEAARREAKTARLRQARLENEAKSSTPAAPGKPRRSRAAKQGSRSSS
ncbi:hypothetical protein [Chelativorans sp. M5D2P16]|uniref:hypothetical protein n=1 Tax=Chelativorans sp. M5D2P16 TaxID=3095678 RepID=UPI002ACA9717|nr:hypothetical protein [Chelativorans sp. M5D2P16]MDZ5699519.1 hypothetical protein [Chelativorans sp. M5D2P16]